MPRRDDDAIFRAVLEQVTPDWYYPFNDDDDNKKWGIGTTGASEYARIRGQMGFPIRFHPAGISVKETIRDLEKGVEATVIANDAICYAEGVGYAFYPNWIGEGKARYRDQFNDRVAVSVAKRNAILDLIPEVHILALLKVRATVAERNKQRFNEQRKAAQKARLAAAPKIRTLRDGENDRAQELTDDPYELAKLEVQPDSAGTSSTQPAPSTPSSND